MQPGLAAPPENVVGRARPFVIAQVHDLALGEAGAEVLAEIGGRPCIGQDVLGDAAVPAGKASQEVRIEAGFALLQVRQISREIAARNVATGQHCGGRPGRPNLGQMRRQPVERLLGEPPIGGDLTAEHGQQRRQIAAGRQLQPIVARHRRRIGGCIVVERAHAAIAPDDIRRPQRRLEEPRGQLQQIGLFGCIDRSGRGIAGKGDVGGADQREMRLVG